MIAKAWALRAEAFAREARGGMGPDRPDADRFTGHDEPGMSHEPRRKPVGPPPGGGDVDRLARAREEIHRALHDHEAALAKARADGNMEAVKEHEAACERIREKARALEADVAKHREGGGSFEDVARRLVEAKEKVGRLREESNEAERRAKDLAAQGMEAESAKQMQLAKERWQQAEQLSKRLENAARERAGEKRPDGEKRPPRDGEDGLAAQVRRLNAQVAELAKAVEQLRAAMAERPK
jgi:hypothetical protein